MEKTYNENDIIFCVVDRHSEALEIVCDDVNLHQLIAFRQYSIHDWQYNLNCWYSVGQWWYPVICSAGFGNNVRNASGIC